MYQFKNITRVLVLGTALLSGQAFAQDTTDDGRLFDQQWYVSPQASYTISDDARLKPGFGGSFAAGYKEGFYAIEAAVVAGSDPSKGGGQDVSVLGGSLNALLFPFKSLPGLYGTIGVGAIELRKYPAPDRQVQFSLTTFDGGLGYLQPLHIGRYRFAIRGEAVYRYGKRENAAPTNTGREDLDAPRNFNDVVIQLGFYLPIGIRPAAAPAIAAEAAQVVPVAEPSAGPDAVPDGGVPPTDAAVPEAAAPDAPAAAPQSQP